ncbi:T9SS type A sorting domain-containing protein [candidate division KSB1 bacterium]|nr:T9SS type A sorting domain-containing protein [candidate division KSB1 bacterium]NIR69403.1 T9SS type A sorting domain-containing protein [candidate division KSB1 bacterium]NIS22753.1 T9SS type A sorting domain-containing protein [candidate division KSB1 bacterium]NIT69600.1 T9SS type A sorting domain-containing protein [candidate division KSB1 bacterium]NIU23261.1 T9SS type A sorting domain-containing protein [candidate division KSB1 bacterium]
MNSRNRRLQATVWALVIVIVPFSNLYSIQNSQALSNRVLSSQKTATQSMSLRHAQSFQKIENAQKSQPAVIYSTLLGGFQEEITWAVAVDNAGDVYVGGLTYSGDFPTAGALDAGLDGTNDCFVSKLDADGSRLLFSTYLGGGGHRDNHEEVTGLVIGPEGNIYVAGQIASEGLPIRNAIQPNFGGGEFDAFIAKFVPDGSEVLYATYFGGSGIDNAIGLSVDADGNAYVTGLTSSEDFPTRNALQSTHGGGGLDAYVGKLNADGSELVYSTYLGGSEHDAGFGIVADSQGNVYLTGSTGSTNFPIKNAVQPSHAGGVNLFGFSSDAFVAKLNSTGSELIFSTYLGGSDAEHFDILSFTARIAVDADGSAYVTGDTQSHDFPTRNAVQADHGGGDLDAFVTKFNATGSEIMYSTYLGGLASDRGRGIIVDPASGHAFVSGLTNSVDFPLENAVQPTPGGGGFDAFLSILEPEGSTLFYSSFLGGNDRENAMSLALDSMGNVYVTGWTASTNFPITESVFQTSNAGLSDAFVYKLSYREPTSVANHPRDVPEAFALHQNYPNPFNPTTTISFSLAASRNVTLTIYNALGQQVRNLLTAVPHQAGHFVVRWDGKDQDGRSVASGVYLYRIQAGNFVEVKKMLLLP